MIIDAHCDALLKMWRNGADFQDSEELQVDYKKWRKSPVQVQCFAIFVPEDVPSEDQFEVALKMVELFFNKIIEPNTDVKFISNQQDIVSLGMDQLGAMLSLEGCHVIGKDINKLKRLIDLGVRAVGLTWNQANAVCDGIGEKRGAGLTRFGEEVVKLLNKEQIWTDLSHISYQGFFDTIAQAEYIMASHSNTTEVYPHLRNLTDHQIDMLVEKDGWIGLTFVPYFTSGKQYVEIDDLLAHINYFIKRGAENCLGFGSDFDGTSETITGLANISEYQNLISALTGKMDAEQLEKMSYRNFIDKYPRLEN